MSSGIYDKLSEERKKLQAEGNMPEHWSTGGWQLFKNKYLYQAKNPREQYERIAATLAVHTPNPPDWKEKFFDIMWKGWLSPSTPVLANTGTNRGLPVSCAGSFLPDSIDGIYAAKRETALLTKYGFGTSGYLGDIRPRGSRISVGGTSEGVLPVIKGFQTDMEYVAQGCYIEGTQVLTDKGFVDFRDITTETMIAQLSDTRGVTFTTGEPTVREWDGDMYTFSSPNGMELIVTPNHRMMIERLTNKTIDGKKIKYWKGFLEETTADTVKYHRDVQHHTAGYSNLISELSFIERFRIAYQADGKKQDVRSENDSFRVRFHFKKRRKINRLLWIMDNLHLKYDVTYSEKSDTTRISVVIDKSLYTPDFSWVNLTEMSGSKGCEFLREVSEWDSYKSDEQSFQYSNLDKKSIDIVQAVASVAGCRTRLSLKTNRGGNRKDIYVLNVRFNYQPVQGGSITTTVNHYAGRVYCCIVPEGRIIVRDTNGFVSVCGNTARRGSWAGYLPIDHGDFFEVIKYLEQEPDGNNIGWNISNAFIARLNSGDPDAIERYQKALKCKMVTGKGYFFFPDKVNARLPPWYIEHGLDVKAAQLCNEITLHSSEEYTYTCVLASMNVARYDEWKDTDAVFIATVFLDCVAQEFIERAKNIKGLEKAVAFTRKGRALGLGQCGFHSLLQSKMIPFESLEAQFLNSEIARHIQHQAVKASEWSAAQWGEPEWCKGYGFANTHLLAIAPTKSTALIMGGVSEGINPDTAMVYTQKSAGGEIDRVNPYLLQLMKDKGVYTKANVESVRDAMGSVQHVDWLTKEEKQVFKTAFEIDQSVILRLAAQRGKYLDQWQSLNLFFAAGEDESYISKVHQEAFMNPDILGLYYIYSMAGVQASKDRQGECLACQ